MEQKRDLKFEYVFKSLYINKIIMSLSVLKYMHKNGGRTSINELESNQYELDGHFYPCHTVSAALEDLLSDNLITFGPDTPFVPCKGKAELTDSGWTVGNILNDPSVVVKPDVEKLKELGIYRKKKDNSEFFVKVDGKKIKVVREPGHFDGDVDFFAKGVCTPEGLKGIPAKYHKFVKEAIKYISHISRITDYSVKMKL
jgi:hypothetical protein